MRDTHKDLLSILSSIVCLPYKMYVVDWRVFKQGSNVQKVPGGKLGEGFLEPQGKGLIKPPDQVELSEAVREQFFMVQGLQKFSLFKIFYPRFICINLGLSNISHQQELQEEITRILTTNNPHAPKNIVRFSFKVISIVYTFILSLLQ